MHQKNGTEQNLYSQDTLWARAWQNQQIDCAPSEDSD